MEFFRETHIDFMGLRKWAAGFSIVLFLLCMAALLHYGLNFGLDFTGGTQIQVQYQREADLPKIRDNLKTAGFHEAQVVYFGPATNVLIRIGPHKDLTQQALEAKVIDSLPIGGTVSSREFIGPQVGKQLANNGALALLVALIGTTIYIALRFELRFAVSSVVALIHDPIVILGIFAYTHMPFDLTTLAGVLTVIGYSLNDTIVVFDRVRENFRKIRKASPAEIINLSVNQTLSRTIMTSGLTLLAVLALYFYGGPKVHSFSLALSVGIIIGTYSSIYVAGSLAVALGLSRTDLLPTPREELDSRP